MKASAINSIYFFFFFSLLVFHSSAVQLVKLYCERLCAFSFAKVSFYIRFCVENSIIVKNDNLTEFCFYSTGFFISMLHCFVSERTTTALLRRRFFSMFFFVAAFFTS